MEHSDKGLVLLAEDDPDQRDILAELLANEGYRVLTASHSAEAIERLGRAPEVVLLDLLGVASPALLRAIDSARPRPGLVLLSADHRLPQLASQLRADAFLLKPYDLRDLLETLAATVQARRLVGEVVAAQV